MIIRTIHSWHPGYRAFVVKLGVYWFLTLPPEINTYSYRNLFDTKTNTFVPDKWYYIGVNLPRD